MSKKLKSYEYHDFLALEYKWYSPVAFFYLFFTILWNALLVMWYATAIGKGAPLIANLFPIFHVAAGVFLLHFTLSSFLNKTNIEVDKEWLTIRHAPIPWWKGNKKIPTSSITQLYVKEKVNRGKNGSTLTYSLRAKLIDQSDKKILDISSVAKADEMLLIERELERFIGINDKPVHGAYKKKRKYIDEPVTPRRYHRTFTDDPLSDYYFLKRGDIFYLHGEKVKVISIVQYDWNDGNTDKLLQLQSTSEEEQMIYFSQNKAILKTYKEEVIQLGALDLTTFPISDPPKSISLSDTTYILESHKPGKMFMQGGVEDIKVDQWVYVTKDGKRSIAVTSSQGLMGYRKRTEVDRSDFNEPLDLNAPPNEQIEMERPDWREEDFV